MSKNHGGNTALRDLLSSVKIKTKREYRDYPNPFITDLSKLGKDGEDHINISQHGNTELGRALANETPIPVNHPLFGKFKSVTGFWYYIKSKERNEKCRKLTGRGLKELSKTLTLSHVKNFRAIILDTVWCKIKQNPIIGTVMVETDLPYECYYEDKAATTRKRLNYAGWFVCGLQDMRDALIQGIEPDFREYLDVKGSGIYEFTPPMNIDDELRYLLHDITFDQGTTTDESDPESDTPTEEVTSVEEPIEEKREFSFADNIEFINALVSNNAIDSRGPHIEGYGVVGVDSLIEEGSENNIGDLGIISH